MLEQLAGTTPAPTSAPGHRSEIATVSVDPTDAVRVARGVILASFETPFAPQWVLDELAAGLAGVVLFGRNVVDTDQLRALCTSLRAVRPDAVIAIDEEGGDVTRLAHATGSPYPGNAALGVVDDVEVTRAVYGALGADLAAVGITVDLAPSVDVNTAEDNPIIGVRAFGAATDLVSRHGVAGVLGLQDAGIAACVKHFPGHGATREDSHHEVPVVDVPLEVLHERELAPFRAAIDAGVRLVMTAHVRVPVLTGDRPATMSRAALTDLLREEMGFSGVIVTDALEMGAIRETVGIGEGAVRALEAGADLLCVGADETYARYVEVRDALCAALASGRVEIAQAKSSMLRTAELASWCASRPPTRPVEPAVGLHAARRAVRLEGTPPLLDRPVVIELQAPPTIAAGPVPWGMGVWLVADSEQHADVCRFVEGAAIDAVLVHASGRPLVVAVRDAHRNLWVQPVIEALAAARPDLVLVEMGLPRWRPSADIAAYVATYGSARANGQAAAELLRAHV